MAIHCIPLCIHSQCLSLSLPPGLCLCLTRRRILDVRPTLAPVVHEGGRLSNPFSCYVNYPDSSHLGGFNVELEEASAAE